MNIDINLDFQSSTPLHEQIARELGEKLARGEFPQGTRLPTVRHLASALQVHFNTVARAYRQLEKDGWLSTRPGRGTFAWQAQYAHTRDGETNLETLTHEYLHKCREQGFSEMEILRELRRQMLPIFPTVTESM